MLSEMKLTTHKKNLLIEFEERCEICSNKGSDLNRLIVHHIKRKREGGTDNHRNLEVVCESCHKEIHFGEFR